MRAGCTTIAYLGRTARHSRSRCSAPRPGVPLVPLNYRLGPVQLDTLLAKQPGVKRRTAVLARLDAYLEILGPGWHGAFAGDLANNTPFAVPCRRLWRPPHAATIGQGPSEGPRINN
jgi:hypothetical protein